MSGGRIYERGYKQSMLELFTDRIYGTISEERASVTFNGIRELMVKGTLFDPFEGRIFWNLPTVDCVAQVSQVFKGEAEVHLKVGEDGLADAIVMIRNMPTHQYAGFQLRGEKQLCDKRCHSTH